MIECRMLDGSPVTVRGQHPQARRGSHVRFVLKKMGWDTMSAMIAICSSMRACGVRVSPSQLSYAGVKDKNALTFQEVRHCWPALLAGFEWADGIKFGRRGT